MTTRLRRGGLALGALAPAACSGWQNTLDPASPQARGEYRLFIAMFVVAAVIYVLVIAAFLYAGLHRRRTLAGVERPTVVSTTADARVNGVVVGAVAITVIVLFGFLVSDFLVGRAQGAIPADVVTVDVVGHQWWWEVQYPDRDPRQVVTTANEIHVPVGVPVQVRLQSHDVIHSFWVPNLRGKKDAVPGYGSALWFQADTPGVYRGQCAEFCGHQHAQMALLVVAEPRDRFATWLAAQQQPAAPPQDSLARAGRQVFLAGACSSCHAIGGEPAYGRIGPDLTHLASRRTLAAGTLPNTPGNLAGWIVDPQSVKPGTRMPPNQLAPDQLQALLAYLETLK